jgi:hypothetical protein
MEYLMMKMSALMFLEIQLMDVLFIIRKIVEYFQIVEMERWMNERTVKIVLKMHELVVEIEN